MSTKNLDKKTDPICERLWRVRRESGLTIQDLIRLSGKSNGWWHRLQHSINIPHYSSVLAVAEKLNIDSDWLLTGKEPEPNWAQLRIDLKLLARLHGQKLVNAVPEMRKKGMYVPPKTMSIAMVADGALPVYIPNLEKCISDLAKVMGIAEEKIRSKIMELIDDRNGEKADGK